MTASTDALQAACASLIAWARDNAVDGLPASGLNDPAKPEFRTDIAAMSSAFALLASEIGAAAAGQSWKAPVDAATTANIDLSSALVNGVVIDGVTLATGKRVLASHQTDATQNGIYLVVASGAASRATDADSGAELVGAQIYVNAGTTNGYRQFSMLTPGPITVGTTALSFSLGVDYALVLTNIVQPLVTLAQSYATAAAASAGSIDAAGLAALKSTFDTDATFVLGTDAQGLVNGDVARWWQQAGKLVACIFMDGRFGIDTLRVRSLDLMGNDIAALAALLGTTGTPVFNTDVSDLVTDDLVRFRKVNGLLASATQADGTELITAGRALELNVLGLSGTNYDQVDARAKAFTAAVHGRVVTEIAYPVIGYNMLVVYGQSLGAGAKTNRALSQTNLYGNLSIGTNVLPTFTGGVDTNATFVPYTDAAFHNLVAVTVFSGTVYTGASETALDPEDFACGEPINHAWANGGKGRLNQRLLISNDTTRTFVTNNISVGGKPIDQLKKSHSAGTIEFYGRYTDLLTKFSAAASTTPASVAGIAWLQGEANYYPDGSGANITAVIDYAGYKSALTGLMSDMQADAMTATGQSLPPGFFTYQTSGIFTNDADGNGVAGLHVGMAQLDAVLASNTAWMVTPAYPYPCHADGHKTPNGSRWMGAQFAKVWHRVAVERRGWQPLRPLKIWRDTPNSICIAYHVPVAPLAFRSPYVQRVATLFAGKGFLVGDATGVKQAPASVTIIRDTIIRLKFGSPLTGTDNQIHVWYAPLSTYGGYGNIADSDPAQSPETYNYDAARGMAAADNITALVGKPYPLWNWGVAFYLPCGTTEIA